MDKVHKPSYSKKVVVQRILNSNYERHYFSRLAQRVAFYGIFKVAIYFYGMQRIT
jgi:hypothetical protein